MKFIGTIFVLVFLAASCEKEVIRPNQPMQKQTQQNNNMSLRGQDTGNSNTEANVTGTEQGTLTGSGIVDPHSDPDAAANSGVKKGK